MKKDKYLDSEKYLLGFSELVGFLLVIIIGLVGYNFQIPYPDLTSNPISRLDVPFYQGILQRVGIILWGSTVIICFLAFSISGKLNSNSEEKVFFLYSFFLFGYLVLDELLLLHNYLFPKILGIHQLVVLIIYAIVVLIYLITFRKIIVSNYSFLFSAGFIFLAISLLIDILSYLKILHLKSRYLFDDGAKFLGIYNLFIYFFLLARKVFITNK